MSFNENLNAFMLGQRLRPGLMGVKESSIEYQVSGIWVFKYGVTDSNFLVFTDENEEPYFPDGVSSMEMHAVNFVSNSVEYSSMSFRSSGNGFHWSMLYGDTIVYTQFDDFYDPAHGTIDFGIIPQKVSEIFYKWLMVNAVKQ